MSISPDHTAGPLTLYVGDDRKAEVYVNEEYHVEVADLLSVVIYLARQGIIRGWLGALIAKLG